MVTGYFCPPFCNRNRQRSKGPYGALFLCYPLPAIWDGYIVGTSKKDPRMKTLAYFIAATSLLAVPAFAQERAAGGAVETQMTWSALSAQIKTTGTKIDAANARIDQIILCGKQGKVYTPGVPGADANGCGPAGGLRWVANGGVNYKHSNNPFKDKKARLAATPTCTGSIGAKCTTKGQTCLSGAIIGVTLSGGGQTSGGSPNSTKSPQDIGYTALGIPETSVCSD